MTPDPAPTLSARMVLGPNGALLGALPRSARRIRVDAESLLDVRAGVAAMDDTAQAWEVRLCVRTAPHLARSRRRGRWAARTSRASVAWSVHQDLAKVTLTSTSAKPRPVKAVLSEMLTGVVPPAPRSTGQAKAPEMLTRGEPGRRVPWQVLAPRQAVPVVDTWLVNPGGFRNDVEGDVGELRCGPGAVVVHAGGRDLLGWAAGARPTETEVARLRELRGLRVVWGPVADASLAVGVVAGLACAGVPLASASVPRWSRPLLGPDVVRLLESASPSGWQVRLRREEDSVALRRQAMKAFGRPEPTPHVSVLGATRRPEMIGHLLSQVTAQQGVRVETVLALHGFTAEHPQVLGALQDHDGEVTVLEASTDELFGDVLNAAVARAASEVVSKMDDDDWYGQHHLADMVTALRYSGADLAGSHAEFVYLEELDTTVRRRSGTEVMTRFVAGGTLTTTKGALREVGGFRPVPRHVDKHLLDDLYGDGAAIYRTHALGMVLRRRLDGHTWATPSRYFLRPEHDQAGGLRASREMGGGWGPTATDARWEEGR